MSELEYTNDDRIQVCHIYLGEAGQNVYNSECILLNMLERRVFFFLVESQYKDKAIQSKILKKEQLGIGGPGCLA